MEIDNAEFENGIKQTITSLEELKTALQFNSAATNVNTLQNAFNSFSLSNIETAVTSLSNRFSTFGIIGMTVIQNLTNGVLGFASRIEKISLGQIMTGGKNRAQKVADARFQLEGLFAKYEDGAERVEKAFNSASKAVDGTAYGLDAAVSTTSQLATSGVELGENMDTALRAIAGSAAMANSSFEEMGYVFNQVAAKGRLQGDEIMQFSSRGLNVLGTLADYMHLTTEEVRDMSSKGQISFQQFAAAMNDAFGDQAQRANETLTGALSNVRAALSRIGEIFYSGIIENKEFIQTVNDLRIAINTVKKAMEPLKDPFKNLVSAASRLGSAILGLFSVENGFTGFVDKVAHGMEVLTSWINVATGKIETFKKMVNLDGAVKEITKVSETIRKLTDDEKDAMLDIFYKGVGGEYGNGEDRINNLSKKFTQESMNNIQDYLNILAECNWDLEAAEEAYGKTAVETNQKVTGSVKDTTKAIEDQKNETHATATAITTINKFIMAIRTALQSVAKVAGAVRNAFVRVFDPKGVMKNGMTFLDTIINLIEAFKVTDETALKIEDTFAGIFSVMDFLITLFTNLFSVIGGIGGPILRTLLDIFLSLTSRIGRVIEKVNKFVKENKFLQSIASKLVTLFKTWYGVLEIFWEKFNNLPAVKKIKDAFQEFYNNTASKLLDFFGKAGDKADGMFQKLQDGDTSKMDALLGNINTALENLIDFADKASESFTTLKSNFMEIKKPIEDVVTRLQAMRETSEKNAKSRKLLLSSDGIMGAFSNATTVFSGFADKIDGIFTKIIDTLRSIDYSKAVLVGFGTSLTALLATLTYFVYNGSKMVQSFTQIGDSVTGVFKSLKKRIYNKDAETAKIIRAVALAIGVLAASLYVLAQCDTEKLKTAGNVVAGLVAVFGVFSIFMMSMAKKVKDAEALKNIFDSVAKMMLALAAAVALMAAALYLLQGVKWQDIWPGLVAMAATMAGLVGAIILLNKFGGDVKVNLITLLAFAGAVYILVSALERLTGVDVSGIKDQLITLLEIMGAVAAIMIAAKGVKLGSALSMLAVIGAVWLIELALRKIIDEGVSMEEIQANMSKFLPIIYILGAVVGALTIVGLASKDAKSQAGTIIACVGLLVAICGALTYLSAISALPTFDKALAALHQVIHEMIVLIIAIGAANGIMRMFGKKGSGSVAGTVIACAVAIGMLALSVAALGLICSPEQLRAGVMAVGALTLFVVALAVFSSYTEKANYKSILAMTAMIASLVVMVTLMSLIADKTALLESTLMVCALLLTLGVAICAICKYADQINVKQILAFILMLGIVAGAVFLLAKYGGGWENVISAAAALGLVMLAMAGLVAILATIMKSSVDASRLVDLILLMKYISLLAVAVGVAMAGVLYFGKDNTAMISAAAALGLVMLALAGAIAIFMKVKFDTSQGAAILLACAALALIGATLAAVLLTGADWAEMAKVAGVMVVTLIAVAAVLGVLGTLAEDPYGAVAFLIVAVSLATILALLAVGIIAIGKVLPILIKCMQDLTKIDYDKIDIVKLGALVGLLFTLGIAAAAVAVGVFTLGLAFLVWAGAIAVIVIALGAAAEGLAKLVNAAAQLTMAISMLISTSKQSGPVIKETVKQAILGLVEGLIEASTEIANNGPLIAQNFKMVCQSIIVVIHEFNVLVMEILLDGIVVFCQKLAEKTPDIVNAIGDVITAILKGIASHALEWGYYGAYMAIEFMNGIMLGLGASWEDLLNSVTALGIDLVEGLANSLYDNSDRIAGAATQLANVLTYTFMAVLDAFTGGYFSKLIPGYKEGMDELKSEIEKYQEEHDISASEERMKLMSEASDKEKDALVKNSKEKWTYAAAEEKANAKNAAGGAGRSFNSELGDTLSGGKDAIKDYLKDQLGVNGESVAEQAAKLNGETYNETLSETMKEVPIEGLPQQAIDAMEADGYRLNEAGDKMVKEIAKGAEDSTGISDTATTLIDDYGGTFTSSENMQKFFNFGGDGKNNVLDGLGNITDTDLTDITNRYIPVGEATINGINIGTESHSPSRKAIRAAKYIAQGLIVGLDNMIGAVTSAASNMGSSAVDSLGDAMSTVTDVLNTADLEDYTPTITPIVDTSQATSALEALNQNFDTTSFKMAADTSLSVNDSSQLSLANEVANLRDQVSRLADTDYSKLLEGVSVNVDARTTVDGSTLRATSAKYTAQLMNDNQRAAIMAAGGTI